ncbi:putative receptor-like serine/threonine-protein kinase [Canna indica]|uniref:Receptor-like serine/threonine-protein kinase n=1 Tax=Canna indica TaxID=4628 RepID=A0AAQ3L078_9LILI|nr:putative receptor-like serine/threonine-protein kinase [Canna indica]
MAKGEVPNKQSKKVMRFATSQVVDAQKEKAEDEGKIEAIGIEMDLQSREIKGNAAKKKNKKIKKDERHPAPQVANETKEKPGEGGKTVVVGIRMDSQSRELLTWALVKAAAPGDSVVALHVLSSPSSSSASVAADSLGTGRQPAAMLSLAKDLGSMLAVYEGFCNLKQIELKLKICNGSSISKVLVREAKAFAASKLVLGVTNNRQATGSSSISVAKYCARKLPSICSVTALSDGKIVFQREAADDKKAQKKKSKGSTKVDAEGSGELFCLLPIAGPNKLNDKDFRRWLVPQDDSNDCSISADDNSSSVVNGSTSTNCSLCLPESDSGPVNGSRYGASVALVPAEKHEAPFSCSEPVAVKDMPEARPGWPSLRRMILINRKSVFLEKNKISGVQWAKWLPSPYSSVHPDLKSKKSNEHNTLNLDGDNSVIDPVGTDLPPPLCLLNDAEGRLIEGLESLQEKYSSVCKIFSYNELALATSNFSHENLIGKGGNSSVYKGCLSNGKELAVKILKPSEDAVKEFLSEVEIITNLHHENIIGLHGFCFENLNLILVYDYVSRGSLEEILHGEKENKYVLNWPDRYKIAVGVAKALDYLHGGGSREPVIHRDVKSSNILLLEDFDPQLSDFGLAKWASASASQLICNDIAGTFGYLAPEYVLYGKVNEKIDVYAFGVVLLELLSGRKPISCGYPKGQESLIMWAKAILQEGEFKKLLDPCLGNEANCDQAERIMLAASLCIRRLHQARPQVALVLKLLLGDDDTLQWARLEVNSCPDVLHDEVSSRESDIRNHLNLALLDVEDDSISTSSTDGTIESHAGSSSVEDYLQLRWSRSSSFD